MCAQIQLLFDDETPPEQIEAVGKSRARKKKAAEKAAPRESAEVPAGLHGWKPEKQYYSIGEVAELFAVNTSLIRYWTREFSLKVRTTRKGDRMYTPEQISELRRIYELVKIRGYTLAGAKDRLRSDKMLQGETIDLKQSLLSLRAKLMIIRNQLG